MGRVRGCYFGGNWNNTANDGLFYFNVNNAPTNTNINIGSRQSYRFIMHARLSPYPSVKINS